MHRVLVIGVGSIGERHLRCFQSTGRAEMGLCEINDGLRDKIASQYGVASVFASLEDALEVAWDAAVVATPAHTHIPIATRLARAGVHLLIEKPLSTSTEGIPSLVEEVTSRRLLAAVAYVYRAHPMLASMRSALAGGRFGRPLEIVAICGQNFPFYRPAYREIYYKDRATGGGAIQDALTHLVNAGEWLAGPVDWLCADAAHQALEGVEVEDTVHLITRQSGALGSYVCNQHQAPNETSITVVCERGTARFEAHACRWRWMTEPSSEWVDEAAGPFERDEVFRRQAAAFMDALEGGAEPLCTLTEGIQTLKANLAALKSAEAGAAPVGLDEIDIG